MKDIKNYIIAILTGLLALSLFTQPAQSAPVPKYVTKTEFQKLVLVIAKEIAKQDGQINELWNCVNSLEVDPGGSGREVFCP
jgi:hypothetical protein